jgi:molecular chaperone IbpA
MTRLSSLDLQPFYRNSIGIDQLFDTMINRIDNSNSTNYPPYNIIKHDDDNYTIEVAVAGFADGEIDVQVNDGQLIITGDKAEVETEQDNYLHQGIGTRKFVRTFQLAEYVEVKTATVEAGILIVSLEREVPEAMKPKSIAITYKS